MGRSDLTFPLGDPVVLVVVLLAVAAIVSLEFMILRVTGFEVGAVARRAISWSAAIAVVAMPLEATFVVFLVLLVLQLASGLALLVAVGTPWGRRVFLVRRMRRRLRQAVDAGPELSPVARLPFPITSAARSFASLGFVQVEAGQRPGRFTHSLMIRPSDGTVLGFVHQPIAVDRVPVPISMMISATRSGDGILSTSVLAGPDLCRPSIAQVIRFAPPVRHLALHDEGRRLLEDRGVRFERTAPSEASALFARVWTQMLISLLDLPDSDLLGRRKQWRRPAMTVASMLDDPVTTACIEGMRDETSHPKDDSAEAVEPGVLPLAPSSAPASRQALDPRRVRRSKLVLYALRADLYRQAASGLSLAPSRRLPLEVTQPASEFEALGFRPIASGLGGRGLPEIVLFRAADGSVGRILGRRGRRPVPRVVLEVSSLVEGQRGAVSTANLGLKRTAWPGEIAQIAPLATCRDLVATHERGVRYLEQLGVRFESIAPDDVLARLSWWTKEASGALLRLSDDELADLGRDVATGLWALPDIAEEPEIASRIQAWRSPRYEGRAGA